ncbi:hypothetical protein C8J57DRAFT_1585154 [Mycena rebaudengoi]|nr:hypothetical protein C8J57DRAFT_1585154 [Mycena rebaudengoi]
MPSGCSRMPHCRTRYVEILMPPLTNRWARLKDDDEDLVPLLECLPSRIHHHRNRRVLPPIRAARLQALHQHHPHHAAQVPAVPAEPRHGGAGHKSFFVVVLDLLLGLTQGLGMELQLLIAASNPNLLSLLTVCLKHLQAPVRQSAYTLVGDMAMRCFVLPCPHMPGIMVGLITAFRASSTCARHDPIHPLYH